MPLALVWGLLPGSREDLASILVSLPPFYEDSCFLKGDLDRTLYIVKEFAFTQGMTWSSKLLNPHMSEFSLDTWLKPQRELT